MLNSFKLVKQHPKMSSQHQLSFTILFSPMRLITILALNLTQTSIFIVNKIYFLDFYANTIQKTHLMRTWFHFVQIISYHFLLCHVDIRSIKANITDFENYLNMMNIDFSIIGVTETWISDVTCNLYSLEGYELLEKHRLNKMGGGVGFFVRNDVNCKLRDDLTIFYDHCESLFIEIDKSVFGSGRDLLIAVIYRPPNTDMKLFIDAMRDVLEKVQKTNCCTW